MSIHFKKKPISLPAEYRPLYRIAQIVMVLKINCNKETSSLTKLHLFSWILKSEENFNNVINKLNGSYQKNIFTYSIEPALNRAIQYAIAENIIYFNKGKYTLTEKGNHFFNLIDNDKNILDKENKILKALGKKISENKANEIYKI